MTETEDPRRTSPTWQHANSSWAEQRSAGSDLWTGAATPPAPHGRVEYEPPADHGQSRDGGLPRRGQARGVGTVANMKQRFESHKRIPTTQIINFRLERYDARGNRLQPVPVEMRGITITGHMADGERVEVFGRFNGGTLYAKSVRNLTTGGGMSTRAAGRFGSRLGRRGETILAALVVLALVLCAGLVPQVYINTPFGLHDYRSSAHGTCDKISAAEQAFAVPFDSNGNVSRQRLLQQFDAVWTQVFSLYALQLSHLTPIILQSRRDRVASLLPALHRYVAQNRARILALPEHMTLAYLTKLGNPTVSAGAQLSAQLNDAMNQLAGGACRVA